MARLESPHAWGLAAAALPLAKATAAAAAAVCLPRPAYGPPPVNPIAGWLARPRPRGRGREWLWGPSRGSELHRQQGRAAAAAAYLAQIAGADADVGSGMPMREPPLCMLGQQFGSNCTSWLSSSSHLGVCASTAHSTTGALGAGSADAPGEQLKAVALQAARLAASTHTPYTRWRLCSRPESQGALCGKVGAPSLHCSQRVGLPLAAWAAGM